jgi:hypothetical protein
MSTINWMKWFEDNSVIVKPPPFGLFAETFFWVIPTNPSFHMMT